MAAIPFGKQPKSRWKKTSDDLHELVFTQTLPGVNDAVKGNFGTPLQTLHYVEALTSAVLEPGDPACPGSGPEPAAAHLDFWKHLHRFCHPSSRASPP